MIKEVRNKNYLERLKELNLWTLEERRNRADVIELFKIYKGFTTVPFESLFTLDCNNKGIRNMTLKKGAKSLDHGGKAEYGGLNRTF